MLEYLNRSYPFNNNLKHNVKIILGIGFGLFLFLILFEPFGLDSVEAEKKTITLAGFGLITGLTLTFNLLIIPLIIPKWFNEDKWKIKNELVWNLWILLNLCGGYFGFSFYSDWFDLNFTSIFKISLLGTVPISVLIAINQDRFLKLNLRSALELNNLLLKMGKGKPKIEIEKISLIAENGKDKFESDLNDILFVRSAGNYVEIFWKDFEVVRKELLRNSLNNVEKVLKNYSNIFKCHRTCLVNVDNINKLAGSSQSYKVVFDGVDDIIPVSRTCSKELQQLINNK